MPPRAAPRISPSDAPESAEPYCATASFSSAISSALIESVTRREPRSIFVTRASTLSPTLKRSGRCSERSRERSERRMNVRMAGSPNSTSIPPEATSVTIHVTMELRLMPPPPLAASLEDAAPLPPSGSPASCLMPSEMRSRSLSTFRTLAFTVSPLV